MPIMASHASLFAMARREYSINAHINEILVTRVIIDDHYEKKHAQSINDEIILGLVQTLDGKLFEPDDVKAPYSYFVTDNIELNGKFYKLIWLLEDHEIYIGVVNAHRE